jgi:hypothetical protein
MKTGSLDPEYRGTRETPIEEQYREGKVKRTPGGE